MPETSKPETTNPTIVHESEAQRQYVRLPIPARAQINGAQYTVKDVSSAGAGIEQIEGNFKKGDILNITLIFPFTDFALDTPLEAQVQNYDKKQKLLGLRFASLTPPQISMLSHIIRSFISGDVIVAGDILDVAKRSDFVRVRNQNQNIEGDENTFTKIKTLLPLALIVLLGLAALTVIANNLYRGTFIISSDTGVITARTMTLKSPVNGTYTPLISAGDLRVTKGQFIADIGRADIQGPNVTGFKLQSPCDCIIQSRKAEAGEYLTQGAAVMDLIPQNANAKIEVFINAHDASRIRLNDEATMQIVGTDTQITGQVTDIAFDDTAITAAMMGQPLTKVIVEPAQKLPIDFIGRPVITEFNIY